MYLCKRLPLYFYLIWLHDNISSISIIIIKHFRLYVYQYQIVCIHNRIISYSLTQIYTLKSYLSIIVIMCSYYPQVLEAVMEVEVGPRKTTVPFLRITQCAFTRFVWCQLKNKYRIFSSGPVRFLFKQNCFERAQLWCTAGNCGQTQWAQEKGLRIPFRSQKRA